MGIQISDKGGRRLAERIPAQTVSAFLKTLGLTPEAAATMAGVSARTVRNYLAQGCPDSVWRPFVERVASGKLADEPLLQQAPDRVPAVVIAAGVERRGWSRKQLAAALGVSSGTVWGMLKTGAPRRYWKPLLALGLIEPEAVPQGALQTG